MKMAHTGAARVQGHSKGMGTLRVQQVAKARRVCMGCRCGGSGDGGTPGQGGRVLSPQRDSKNILRRGLHPHNTITW